MVEFRKCFTKSDVDNLDPSHQHLDKESNINKLHKITPYGWVRNIPIKNGKSTAPKLKKKILPSDTLDKTISLAIVKSKKVLIIKSNCLI